MQLLEGLLSFGNISMYVLMGWKSDSRRLDP
jgi:hypothetical protein